jgi:FKBP-type peptidyl-prolyl cis-trans isomerase SlyD
MSDGAHAVGPNTLVSLEYTLYDDAGELLDQSEGGHGIQYVHGYGMLVPGLESALGGLRAGDEREILVPAASGYGERDEGMVMELDRSELPHPEEAVMRVILVKEDAVVVDANHPLAGIALRYSVKVRAVREATEEEIERAARELAEAEEHDHEHEHGPGCDHDHDHGGEELITLGKRKSTPN